MTRETIHKNHGYMELNVHTLQMCLVVHTAGCTHSTIATVRGNILASKVLSWAYFYLFSLGYCSDLGKRQPFVLSWQCCCYPTWKTAPGENDFPLLVTPSVNYLPC